MNFSLFSSGHEFRQRKQLDSSSQHRIRPSKLTDLPEPKFGLQVLSSPIFSTSFLSTSLARSDASEDSQKMFRPIKGGVRPPWSSSAQSLRGKEKDKDVERAAPGESQKPSGLNKVSNRVHFPAMPMLIRPNNQAFVVASQPDKIATAQCASKVIQIVSTQRPLC